MLALAMMVGVFFLARGYFAPSNAPSGGRASPAAPAAASAAEGGDGAPSADPSGREGSPMAAVTKNPADTDRDTPGNALTVADGEVPDAVARLAAGRSVNDPRALASALAWLEAHADDGRLPCLHLLALGCAQAGRTADAGRWFAAASLVGRADAFRFEDDASARRLTDWEPRLADLRRGLLERPAPRDGVIARALAYEEAHRNRSPAWWLVRPADGSGAEASPPVLVADERWHAQRGVVRAAFRRQFLTAGLAPGSDGPGRGPNAGNDADK